MLITSVFTKNAAAKTRYSFNQGGTRSSKTYSLMQLAYWLAYNHSKDSKIISIVSESMPHLKRGAMRDFFHFLQSNNIYQPSQHNKTDNSYRLGNSIIEFFSCDSPDKVHGPGRDFLFVNEIQNIKYETFFHLAQRTNKRIYADYNPTHEFWVYPEFINNTQYTNDLTYIHSTIFDNPFVSEHIKKDVLLRAERDSNYKRVYLDGEPGTLEGIIFYKYSIIDEFPNVKKIIFGMDWGFSNDPTTLIKVGISGDDVYVEEMLYKTGLTNSDISNKLTELGIKKGTDKIIADSAEPKSIEELRRLGWFILPSEKGPDSIRQGIDLLKQKNLHVTKSSLNIINELRNYRWETDKNGAQTGKPVDSFNHTIDPWRYVMQNDSNTPKFILV